MSTLHSANGTPETPRNSTARNGAQASSSPAPAPATATERDGRGRFAAGNKGGPGNPFSRRVAGLRQALLEAVAPDDLRAIIAKMVESAKQGDVAAARLVLAYTVGKPAAAVDPDTLDVQEWSLWQQMPVLAQALQSVLGPLQVPLACTIARTVLPLMQGSVSQQLAQQLDPSAAVPPVPVQPQPQASAPAAPPARPAPAAPVENPTPEPGLAAPTAQVTPNGAQAQPRKRKQEKESAGRAAARPAPSAAGGPTEPSADAQAELNRLLALCQQLLGPAPSASANLSDLNPEWDLDALLRT